MTIPARILPVDRSLSENESKEQGRITPLQEDSIVRVLAEPTRGALIADQTGFGKTLIASEVIVRAGFKRTLLVIIGKTFNQWQERLSLQSDGAISLRRLDATKAGQAAYRDFLDGKEGAYATTIQWAQTQDWKYEPAVDTEGNPIFKIIKKTGEPVLKERPEGVIGPAATPVRETMRTHLKIFDKMSNRQNGGLDAIIFDEVHAVANRNSIGRRTLLTLKSEWKIGMSATWSGNDFALNAWSCPRWIWPTLIPAYWAWSDIWVTQVAKKDIDGNNVYVGGKLMTKGQESSPGAFVRSLPLYLRRERPEKAPEAIEILVEATPQQRAQYAELKEELLAWVQNFEGEREPLVIDIPAVLRTRLRQVALAELSLGEKGEVTFAPGAASAKLRALKGILDHWGDQPVVLMTDSRLFAKLTAERMTAAGYRAEAWVGGVSEKELERIKKDFVEGRLKYIVMTVQAGGTGVDSLQFASSKIIWLSVPDGDPKLEEQALGRVFRPGMTTKYGAFAHVRLLMTESLDVEILENLIRKGRNLRSSIGAAALIS